MDVQQLRKRLKKRAKRAWVTHDESTRTRRFVLVGSTLNGAAQVFDLGATFKSLKSGCACRRGYSPWQHDAEALQSDWEQVGNDLWKALADVTDDLDDEALARVVDQCRRSARKKLAESGQAAEMDRAVAATR